MICYRFTHFLLIFVLKFVAEESLNSYNEHTNKRLVPQKLIKNYSTFVFIKEGKHIMNLVSVVGGCSFVFTESNIPIPKFKLASRDEKGNEYLLPSVTINVGTKFMFGNGIPGRIGILAPPPPASTNNNTSLQTPPHTIPSHGHVVLSPGTRYVSLDGSGQVVLLKVQQSAILSAGTIIELSPNTIIEFANGLILQTTVATRVSIQA